MVFSVEDSPLDYSPGGFYDESVWREFKGVGGGWSLEEEVRRKRREGDEGNSREVSARASQAEMCREMGYVGKVVEEERDMRWDLSKGIVRYDT